jgi:uncharacterized membrane protein
MPLQSDSLRALAPTPAEVDTAEHVRALFGPVWHWVGAAIEAVGIVVLVVGLAVATVRYLRHRGAHDAYHTFRSDLGRSILLGLEFLVAADLVGTVVVEPTFENLGVLGLIVLIRTFLSFALETEISGHWPWKDSAYHLRARRAEGSPSDGPVEEV